MKALGDRRVTLHLTPELHYGQEQQTWISEDGRLMPQSGKPKHVFDHLAFDATLATDQMLVLTTSPERSGTLGHYFFTEPQSNTDDVRQKMIVIRLAKTRYDDLFSAPGTVVATPSTAKQAEPSEKHDSTSPSDSGAKPGSTQASAVMAGSLRAFQ